MITRIEDLTNAVDQLSKVVAGERQARRLALGVVGAAAIVVVTLASGCFWFLWDEANEERAIRDQSRIASCEQFNEQQERSIHGNAIQIREVLRGSSIEGDRLADLLQRHDAAIMGAFPLRDCTPKGINAYFDDDPSTDPYVK